MTSVFADKTQQPDIESLKEVLGEAGEYFARISETISRDCGNLVYDWKFYGQKSGWSLKMLCNKRNMFFLVPHEWYFEAAFSFGGKAVEEILNGDFSGSDQRGASYRRSLHRRQGAVHNSQGLRNLQQCHRTHTHKEKELILVIQKQQKLPSISKEASVLIQGISRFGEELCS